MRSDEARISADIECAVAILLGRYVQGATAGQSRDYIAQLRTTAGALEHEEADIFALADEEEAMLSPPAERPLR